MRIPPPPPPPAFGNPDNIRSDAERVGKQLKTIDQLLEEMRYLKQKMLLSNTV
jgi:hypothetical protein